MARKKLNPLLMFGAAYEQHGYGIKDSWKYELVVDYLKASPSYEILSRAIKKGLDASKLNADGKLIAKVIEDFGAIYKLREVAWWETIGMHLYGVRAPHANVELLGTLSEENRKITAQFEHHQSLVVTLPLGLTISETIKQIKQLADINVFAAKPQPNLKPKYQLFPSKLTRRTLQLGLEALRLYKSKDALALWEIGHRLMLVPTKKKQGPTADEKISLSIAASRLIKTAALVAENAARGRFPCSKNFKEANLPAGKRSPGRPYTNAKSH